jgi:hypothetical protein
MTPLPKDEYERRYEPLVNYHTIVGVTEEMIDWFWANMEKCYYLWSPDEHVHFEWEIPPTKNGFVGAIHFVREVEPPMPEKSLRMRFQSPNTCPMPLIYSHAVVIGRLAPDAPVVGGEPPTTVHEWEAVPNGVKMRSTYNLEKSWSAKAREALSNHNKRESLGFPRFLPALYVLYQPITNAKINVQYSLKYDPITLEYIK